MEYVISIAESFLRPGGNPAKSLFLKLREGNKHWEEHGEEAQAFGKLETVELLKSVDPNARATPIGDGETFDPVNKPKHYNSHPSGVECITVTKHMNFCIGNAMKYLWRAGLKGDAIEDLRKAAFYLQCEIDRLSSGGEKPSV